MNLIYRFLIDNTYKTYDMKIEKAIRIMEEYKMFINTDEDIYANANITFSDPDTPTGFRTMTFSGPDTPMCFRTMKDGKVSYDIFYLNLHIRVKEHNDDIIYSIYIKKDEDDWVIKDGDYGHPTNKRYRVYIWYNVSVLDVTRATDSIYIHGNWDKYVFNTLGDFSKLVDNCTDKAKFNIDYK